MVVLMLHGSVLPGKANGNPLLRDPSCKKERMLSNTGIHESQLAGDIFRERKIPISEVRFSPFCRTSDTAKIAFRMGTPAEYLSLIEILSPEEASTQIARLNKIIGSYTGKGNLVLITHKPNISAISFETIGTLQFLVMQPKGGSEYEELGAVSLNDENALTLQK